MSLVCASHDQPIGGSQGIAPGDAAPDGQDGRAQAEEWTPTFIPAICHDPSGNRGDGVWRNPEWFVVRFEFHGARLFTRILQMMKLDYHHLQYEHRRRHKKPTLRSWLPGYMFVQTDLVRDYWQQLYEAPHFLGMLGGPTPISDHEMGILVASCPFRIAKTAPEACIPNGAKVKVLRGSYENHIATVIDSDRKTATVNIWMFNQMIPVALSRRDIQVVDI